MGMHINHTRHQGTALKPDFFFRETPAQLICRTYRPNPLPIQNNRSLFNNPFPVPNDYSVRNQHPFFLLRRTLYLSVIYPYTVHAVRRYTLR